MVKRGSGPCSITAPWRRLDQARTLCREGEGESSAVKKDFLQTLLFNGEPNKGVPESEA